MLVLVGFMGAGKTTIGRLTAERSGLPFIDSDELIERRAGRPIRDIFETDGEATFRQLEHETIVEAVRGPEAVVALGGGAVQHPGTRECLADVPVVYLEVPLDEALRRTGTDTRRPMLTAYDAGELHRYRTGLYERVASLTVDTVQHRPDAIVEHVLGWYLTPPTAADVPVERVLVTSRSGAYNVFVGRDIAGRTADFLPLTRAFSRAHIVWEPAHGDVAALVEHSVQDRGTDTTTIEGPTEPEAKTPQTVVSLYDAFADRAAHPDDLVIAVGGAAFCEAVGFAASTFNRGMPLVYVPTAVLAQVDAMVGGKTAINLTHGRNLVGTYHQPALVICDVAVTASQLSSVRARAGLAEVVKHALIADTQLLDVIRAKASALVEGDVDALLEIVTRSVQVKSHVIHRDERELGDRLYLNYGHTFAYAFEHLWGTSGDRHGEAVALGMVAAAELAHILGIAPTSIADLHRDILQALGLTVSASFDVDELLEAFKRDKKYEGGPRFVVLRGLGQPEVVREVPQEALAAALARLAG